MKKVKIIGISIAAIFLVILILEQTMKEPIYKLVKWLDERKNEKNFRKWSKWT